MGINFLNKHENEAREMTRQIEAATEVDVQKSREEINAAADAALKEISGQLGRTAIFSGESGVVTDLSGSMMRPEVVSDQTIHEMVARENGYSESKELDTGASVIGGDSELQRTERQEEDLEEMRLSAGVDLKPGEKLDSQARQKVQEQIGQQALRAVEDWRAEKAPHPAELAIAQYTFATTSVKQMDGYSYGSRN